MDGKPKLVCFDLNKTLILENTWLDLNRAMGVTDEEDEKFLTWYEEGKVTYEEGQRFLEKIYCERGKATKDGMLKAISSYQYMDHAEEIIEYLKKKNYKLCLLSGSIDLLVEKVADDLGIEMWAAHNRLLFDEDDNFRKILCDGDDIDFKMDKLIKFAEQSGVKLEECVCVGDALNDKKIFAATGHGICLKGARIENLAWKVIDKLDDLKKIL